MPYDIWESVRCHFWCNYLDNFLFNFERILVLHFYSQFYDLGYKKFLICSEKSNILYRQTDFPFNFADFDLKNCTFLWNLNCINLYKQMSCVTIWESMFIVVIFTFFFVFGLNSKYLITITTLGIKILNLNLKQPLK